MTFRNTPTRVIEVFVDGTWKRHVAIETDWPYVRVRRDDGMLFWVDGTFVREVDGEGWKP